MTKEKKEVTHDPEIRVGTWRFVHMFEGKYKCPRCTLVVLRKSIHQHMDVHDRREARKRDSAAFRELGMGAEPLPGQLGMFGVPDVERERR